MGAEGEPGKLAESHRGVRDQTEGGTAETRRQEAKDYEGLYRRKEWKVPSGLISCRQAIRISAFHGMGVTWVSVFLFRLYLEGARGLEAIYLNFEVVMVRRPEVAGYIRHMS